MAESVFILGAKCDEAFRFSHYFGGDKTEDQHKHFKAMMSGVKEDTDQYFSIQFECSGTGDDCKNIKDAS